VVPSVLNSFTVTPLIVLLAMCTVTCWDAVPENVSEPFCPGAVVVTPTPLPPIVTVPVVSAGTSYDVSVTLPVSAPSRSTVTVSPDANVHGSKNSGQKEAVWDARVPPAAFRTVTVVKNGAPDTYRLTRELV